MRFALLLFVATVCHMGFAADPTLEEADAILKEFTDGGSKDWPRLVALAEAGPRICADTPGAEAAHSFDIDWRAKQLDKLRGPDPDDAAVKGVCSILSLALRSARYRVPEEPIRVPRTHGPVTIDGVIDAAEWKPAIVITTNYLLNETEPSERDRTTYRLMWDERNLYLSWDCVDDSIQPEQVERDGPLYTGDCVEAFIMPDRRMKSYWEIIVGANGVVFDGLRHKNPRNWAGIDRTDETMKFLSAARVQDKPGVPAGYSVEAAVPFSELPDYGRAAAAPGQKLQIMLNRIDRTSDKQLRILSFRPIFTWNHNVWCYVPIVLAD
jgi:hypothetical protein